MVKNLMVVSLLVATSMPCFAADSQIENELKISYELICGTPKQVAIAKKSEFYRKLDSDSRQGLEIAKSAAKKIIGMSEAEASKLLKNGPDAGVVFFTCGMLVQFGEEIKQKGCFDMNGQRMKNRGGLNICYKIDSKI